jgi:hypothetical protein
MTDIPTSLTIELKVQRASSGTADGLAEVARSLVEALKEATDSGVKFPAVADASADLDLFVQMLNRTPLTPTGGTVGRGDVGRLRDALAVSAWAEPKRWFSEVALSDLHVGECGWGPGGDAPGPLRTVELAIDVLDFCGILLGPDDHLEWNLVGPRA